MNLELKQLLSLRTIWYLAFGAFFAYVVPILFSLSDVNEVIRIEFILFIINVIYAVVTGVIAGKARHSIIFTLIFPALYQVSYTSFFVSFSAYVKYFGIVYLVMTLLAYGANRD